MRPTRSKLIALLTASITLVLLAATPGASEAHPPPEPSGSDFTVTLEDDSGRTLRTFYHRGRTFVLGRHGERYNVRIRNRTARRVEAVLTVDGRDAISGRPGSYRERGYILRPRASVLVPGFRRSLNEVAAFRFTDPGNSYSARMGTPENVGVIGVAFFHERRPRPPITRWPRPYPRPEARRNPNPRAGDGAEKRDRAPRTGERSGAPEKRTRAPRAESRTPSRDRYYHGGERDNLGTEYGEDRTSRVVEVPFERRNPRHPDDVITLRYDDERGLEARGIEVDRRWDRRWDCDWDDRFARYPPEPCKSRRFAPPPPPYYDDYRRVRWNESR